MSITGFNLIKDFMNGKSYISLERSVCEENEMGISYYKNVTCGVPQVIRNDKKEGFTIEFDICKGENGYWNESCTDFNIYVIPIKRFTNKEIRQILDIAINGIKAE